MSVAKKCFLFLCLNFLMASLYCVPSYVSSAIPKRNVKIGFFQSDGYYMMNDEGIKSGYGYDFLQMLLRYNDWDYTYLGYDKPWSEVLAMLDSGEVDLITLVDKTPERELKYGYTKEPLGMSSSILTMNSANTSISIGDYSTYDGKRVGLVEGSSHNSKFEQYAKEHNFSYVPVYYHLIDDLIADITENKNVDLALTSNMRKITNETIVDEFNLSFYYAIARFENKDLLREIDNSIRQLDIYSKDWRNILFSKYYSDINNDAISFSVEERRFLKVLNENNIPVVAVMNPELKPYSYFENGVAKGIVPEIFNLIAKKLNISYTILPAKNRNEYKALLASEEVDIDLTAFFDYSIGQKYMLKETEPYLSSFLAQVYTDDSNLNNETLTVATVKDPTEFYSFNSSLIYNHLYKEFDSLKDCIQAVKNGQADVTYTYAYCAEQAVATDYTNKLKYSVLPNSSFNLSLGISLDEDHRLLSVLNKGVKSLNDGVINKIIHEESSLIEQTGGIIAFAYSNPVLVIFIISLILIILFSVIILEIRVRHQSQEILSSYEFERFVSYICESYDQIEEINLKKRTKKSFQIIKGVLSIETKPFFPYDVEYFKTRVAPEDVDKMVSLFSEKSIQYMFENDVKENFFDCRVKNEVGKYQWYSYIIKIIPVDDNHPKNVIIFKKNTQTIKDKEDEQRLALTSALANAQKANNAKGLFVSKISHEIRTPLNAIIGYLNIASEKIDDISQVDHCIRNCRNASSHLLGLINDVLDLSAIENNKLKIANEEFDFKETITEICTVYYTTAEQKGVKFRVDIHGLTEEHLIGDSLRTKQIMMNLLSNAIKFTPENGFVDFKIDQVTQTEKETHIRFVVKDTGIGMDNDFLSRLFSPFEQETAVTAQKFGGSGLGLSITKNLVDLLNGSISVQSEKNVGSEFTVVLSFERCTQKIPNTVLSFPDVRALIVSPNENTCGYIKVLLKRCSVKADAVDSSELALKRIIGRKGSDFEYSLCLIDCTESDLNSHDLIGKIIEQDPINHLEIVPITYDSSEIKESVDVYGIKKIIEKPLFQSNMVDMLMELYGNQKVSKKIFIDSESLHGMNVLLAEDNDMNMEIAIHVLGKAGVTVTPASDGIQASNLFIDSKPGTFQAVLMDIQMPNMDGYEATRKIRSSSHPDAKTIPIIALTANAFSEDVSKALNAGMNDHISKPIDEKKLYKVLLSIYKKE